MTASLGYAASEPPIARGAPACTTVLPLAPRSTEHVPWYGAVPRASRPLDQRVPAMSVAAAKRRRLQARTGGGLSGPQPTQRCAWRGRSRSAFSGTPMPYVALQRRADGVISTLPPIHNCSLGSHTLKWMQKGGKSVTVFCFDNGKNKHTSHLTAV